MKTAFVSALAVAGAIGVAISDTTNECVLKDIELTLLANKTIASAMEPAQTKCEEDTGVDIFDITEFPSKETALEIQQSDDGCNVLINIVNGYTNINTQCTITLNGTAIVYGRLISDFLDGKTGNESDSASGSAGIPSESDSGSESESSSSKSSSSSSTSSTSGSATTALSFVTYGAIAAIAVALR